MACVGEDFSSDAVTFCSSVTSTYTTVTFTPPARKVRHSDAADFFPASARIDRIAEHEEVKAAAGVDKKPKKSFSKTLLKKRSNALHFWPQLKIPQILPPLLHFIDPDARSDPFRVSLRLLPPALNTRSTIPPTQALPGLVNLVPESYAVPDPSMMRSVLPLQLALLWMKPSAT
ncbi:hypothetical protein LENED_006656 [Lentinula edodes]|uniref:Uncharacterized protein n=1 Tax=Lentinula edodes TaxID=5353 RepID=A0A1Q3ECC3_LENED|nr:hypothetical protein LENED_006656 [Lentinula edodes]